VTADEPNRSCQAIEGPVHERGLDRVRGEVSEVAFELFDGTHMGIESRYTLSLRYLAERLSA
jgi:hypothetical protein